MTIYPFDRGAIRELVERLGPDFDPYAPEHTMQFPGGGLNSVRRKP